MIDANPQRTNNISGDHSPDPENLSLDWEAEFGSGDIISPIVGNRFVFTGVKRPEINIRSFNWQSGMEVWEFKSSNYTRAPPVLSGNRTTVGNNNGVIELDIESGDQKEVTPTDESIYGFLDVVSVSDYTVFITQSGVLGVVDAQGNNIEWTYNISAPNYPVEISVANNSVFLVTDSYTDIDYNCEKSGGLYVLDLESGDIQWETILDNGIRNIAVTDENVIIGGDGRVSAYGRTSKEKIWDIDVLVEQVEFAIRDNLLVIGGYKSVKCIDVKTGEEEWKSDYNSISIHPAISGETVFIVGSSGSNPDLNSQIKTMDIESGEIHTTVDLREEQLFGPAIGHNYLYISTGSGKLYGYNGGGK